MLNSLCVALLWWILHWFAIIHDNFNNTVSIARPQWELLLSSRILDCSRTNLVRIKSNEQFKILANNLHLLNLLVWSVQRNLFNLFWVIIFLFNQELFYIMKYWNISYSIHSELSISICTNWKFDWVASNHFLA